MFLMLMIRRALQTSQTDASLIRLTASFMLLILLTACGGDSSTSPVQPLPALPTVDELPAYEVIGSGPMVVVLATAMQETLYDSATTDTIVLRLLSAGYSVMSLDLPCHGADAEPGVQPLDCWARRIAAGDQDIFLSFCAGLFGVLDRLDASTVGMVGISRGAYVAITCAAYDERFRDLALEIPVTDLNYLTEFKSRPVDQTIFGTDQYVPYISNRTILVRIGKDDERVGTLLAVAFAKKVGSTLELTDAVGHDTAEDGSTIAWLQAHPFYGGGGSQQAVCSPLSYGAVGDGVTDNTDAIQNAVNACAAQGGGIVELSAVGENAVYVTGPLTLKSHVYLHIDQGVTLQATNDHSRYVAAYINWVYQPNEALISAKGATDVGIMGEGTIDGASDQADPNDGGRTWYEVAAAESAVNRSTRPYLIEFYQCDHVTISGVTIRRHPYWAQALRFSSNIVESGVTIDGQGRNSDGVDLVGVTNVTLSDLDISVSDDNIAIKSGLPISPSDPYYAKEIGLPQMPTSHVLITNIIARTGQGISIGSEAANGVNDVTIENVRFTNILYGFRIKTARDRGGDIHDIKVKHLVMEGVGWPIGIDSYDYSAIGPDPHGPAQPITPTTPRVHDINIQDIVATGTTGQSHIRGLPESCINNVTLDGVSIQTSGMGMELLHMTGSFNNVTSTPPPPNPPFVVKENVTVNTTGTTPEIPPTPPLAGQMACR